MICPVAPIHLKPHPETDSLMIGEIAGHQVVVGNHYDEGTLGFFIPDGAIVPDKLAEEMWVKGKLAGSQKNRVKARKIKGIFSEGLFFGSQFFLVHSSGELSYHEPASWNPKWREGDNVAEEVGIT